MWIEIVLLKLFGIPVLGINHLVREGQILKGAKVIAYN